MPEQTNYYFHVLAKSGNDVDVIVEAAKVAKAAGMSVEVHVCGSKEIKYDVSPSGGVGVRLPKK